MELRVKEICKEKGLLFKQLADKIGISDVGLRKQVQGNPSLKTMETIAEALDVPVWQLLVSKNDIQLNNENESLIVRCPYCHKNIPISIKVEAVDTSKDE